MIEIDITERQEIDRRGSMNRFETEIIHVWIVKSYEVLVTSN